MILSLINIAIFILLITITIRAIVLDSTNVISIPKTDRTGLIILMLLSIFSIITNISVILDLDFIHKKIDHETIRAIYELVFAIGMIWLVKLKLRDYGKIVNPDTINSVDNSHLIKPHNDGDDTK